MGRNNADFDYSRVEYFDSPPWGHSTLHTVLARHPDGGILGRLELTPPDEQGNRIIWNIDVAREHRRHGVGTQLVNYAAAIGLNPVHDKVRTDEGDAFAKSFGEDVPERTADSR